MAKILVISDIHSNNHALEAVVNKATADIGNNLKEIWVLGDMVGRGPNPVEVLTFLMEEVLPGNWVLGNHDVLFAEYVRCVDLLNDPDKLPEGHEKLKTSVGFLERRVIMASRLEWEVTNAMPLRTIIKNREAVDQVDAVRQFAEQSFFRKNGQPKYKQYAGLHCVLVHANVAEPIGPYIYPWEVQVNIPRAFEELANFFDEDEAKKPNPNEIIAQFYGHTHIPTLVEMENENVTPLMVENDREYKLEPGKRYLINPGSVGQSRDFDIRASYAIFDPDEQTIFFKKTDYNRGLLMQDLIDGQYPDDLVMGVNTPKGPSNTPAEWKEHFLKQAELQNG